MKNGITIFKYLATIICLLILAWILRDFGCGKRGGNGTSKTDTISIRHDTVIHVVDTFVSYQPKPYKVTVHDTLEIDGEPIIKWQTIPDVVTKAFKDYNSTKYYKDSFDVTYGKLYIYDTVHKNNLKGAGFNLKQSIPEITNTITVKEKPRTIAYIGLEILGSKTEPLGATGASFGLKFKNDNYLGLKGMILKSGQPLYGISYMRPIRLRKR